MIGTILNQRYRIEAELGRGGMGIVYHAHDRLLERDVAVKMVSSHLLGSKGRARLMQEARAIAKLNHPNIVAVHDAGELDGETFIVMELVHGHSLHDDPPEGFEAIVSAALQICNALNHVHRQNIVHRDLKPENVLVDADGTCKLVDFGIARSMASRMTAEGEIIGTVFYLAPELALGQEIDGRTDLYALGVILYELVTGMLPFRHSDPLQVISQHLHTSVIPPRLKNPQVPPLLDALIVQLLSKTPGHRPASALEVMERLRREDILRLEAKADRELQILDRIARGRFVGREHDLAVVKRLWNNILLGKGQILLVSGEPGIGKTRLTRELATYVEVTGGRVLTGACSAEGGAPYAPFAQIVRAALGLASIKGLNLPDAMLADLLSLAPDMQSSYPRVEPNPPLEPLFEQQRLFENVAAFLSSLSREAPLLLVIDDAHWADSASLSLVRHLARTLESQRILLLASHREVERDPGHPFQQMLHHLNRERIAVHLELDRLTLAETGSLLTAILQEKTTPDFLEGIYRQTEGNPFFVEEVCKALVQEGRLYYAEGRWHHPSMQELEIPQSVRIAIETQLAKLPPAARETLLLAAVLGREFDFDILVEASAKDEDALMDALAAAERAQLIEDVSSAGSIRHAFVHALIPSTMGESVPALQRRRLQRRAAKAIESLRPEEYEELARLYSLSGDEQKALTYHTEAGQRAYRLNANQEAIAQYSRALEIAKRIAASDDRLVHLYTRLGRTYEVCGQYDDALSNYIELESRGRERDHAGLELAGLLSQVTVLSMPSAKWDPERAERIAQKALTLAQRLKDPRAESRAYWNLMLIENYLERDLETTVKYGQQALTIARKHELLEEQAYALHDLASVYSQLGEAQRALGASQEARQLWRDLGDKPMLADNLASAAVILAYTGEVRPAKALAEEALEISRSIHSLWGWSFSLAILGWLLLQSGEVGRAVAALEESYPIAQRVDFTAGANFALSLLADAFRRLGEPGRASDLVEHALSRSGDRDPYYALPLRLKAVLQAARGEVAAAKHTVKEARKIGLQARADPIVSVWADQMEIEVTLSAGEYDRALPLAEVFRSELQRAQMLLFLPEALLKEAQALRGLGREDEARRTLSKGQDGARALKLRLALMELLVERFELELQTDSSQEAEQVRRAASEAVADIADRIEHGPLRDRFLDLPRVRAVMQD